MDSTPRDPLVRLAQAIDVAAARDVRESDEEVVLRHPELGDLLRPILAGTDAESATFDPTGSTAPEVVRAGASPPTRLGPYVLLRELGRGGQSEVHLALDTRLGRHVALKLLRAPWFAAEERRERFRREASLTSRLDHPGIAAVHEAGVLDGIPFIAMRYVEGETFAAWIDARRVGGAHPGPDDFPVAAAVVRDVARAVHVAHEAGILHRDLKPGNVIVTRDGSPVVLDFGLARLEVEDAPLTRTGAVFGTPAYMAPEQVEGAAAIDRRTDVYALGVTLYEACAGQRPFEAPTALELSRAVVDQVALRPSVLNPAVSRDLETIVLTAMAKEPGRRYLSALALAEDLDRFLAHRPILARRVSAIGRLRLWTRRRPVVAALLVAVFASLVAGLAASLHFLGKAQRQSEARSEALRRLRVEFGRAEGNLDTAFDTVDRMLVRVSEERFARDPALRDVRIGVLGEAVALYESLLRQAQRERVGRISVARVRVRLGAVLQLQGRSHEAENHLREGLAELRTLREEGASELVQDESACAQTLAEILTRGGRATEAERVLRDVLRSIVRTDGPSRGGARSDAVVAKLRGTLGNALQLQERFVEAQAELELAVAALDALPPALAGIGRASAWMNLAIVRWERDDDPGAVSAAERALAAIGENPIDVEAPASLRSRVRALTILGYALAGSDPKAALERFVTAWPIAEALVRRDAETPGDVEALADVRAAIGRHHLASTAFVEATGELDVACGLYGRVLAADPTARSAATALARTLAERGLARLGAEDLVRARKDEQESRRRIEALPGGSKGLRFSFFHPSILLSTKIVKRLTQDGVPAEAASLVDEGREFWRRVASETADHPRMLSALAELNGAAGKALTRVGRTAEARAAWLEARGLSVQHRGRAPGDPHAVMFGATAAAALALLAADAAEEEVVLRFRDEALHLARLVEPKAVSDPWVRAALPVVWDNVAMAFLLADDHAGAAGVLRELPPLARDEASELRRVAIRWIQCLERTRRRDEDDPDALRAARERYVTEAIRALEGLVDTGERTKEQLALDPDYTLLRSQPRFQAWLSASAPGGAR